MLGVDRIDSVQHRLWLNMTQQFAILSVNQRNYFIDVDVFLSPNDMISMTVIVDSPTSDV